MYKLILPLVFASFVASTVVAVSSGRADNDDTQSERIKVLLTQRRDTLRERLNLFQQAAHRSEVGSVEVMGASNDLLNAEIDLADDATLRTEFMKQVVENMKKMEQLFLQGSRTGQVSKVELLEVRAERLQAEIKLAKEQGTR